MGRWGMGISSSDEHADVKEEFFYLYYAGIEITKIEEHIISYYEAQADCYPTGDGIWNDLYFALADCEWKCGKLSSWLLNAIEKLIADGSAVEYFRELDASESNLKIWARNLQKFLAKITSQNPKPLVQRIKRLYVPPVDKGDFFIYQSEDTYRSAIVLDRYDHGRRTNKNCFAYCITIAAFESKTPPVVKDVENAQVFIVKWFDDIPKKEQIKIIGSCKSKIKRNCRMSFYHGILADFAEKIKINKKYKSMKALF